MFEFFIFISVKLIKKTVQIDSLLEQRHFIVEKLSYNLGKFNVTGIRPTMNSCLPVFDKKIRKLSDNIQDNYQLISEENINELSDAIEYWAVNLNV